MKITGTFLDEISHDIPSNNWGRKHMPVYPVYVDLVDLFLDEAERCHMDFYLGLYDSGKY